MIRINMTCQDTNHPDKRLRHQGRAWCEVDGRRFETKGPAPIYKLATLLWLYGHGGADFEVWDNLSPYGKPGGLAMTGRVRNWARLINGKPSFNKDAPFETDFSPQERDLIAQAAGQVLDATEIDSPRPDNARTGVSRPSDGPDCLQEQDGAPAELSTVQRPEAA